MLLLINVTQITPIQYMFDLIQWLLIQMIVRPIDSVSQIVLANCTRLDILHSDCNRILHSSFEDVIILKRIFYYYMVFMFYM